MIILYILITKLSTSETSTIILNILPSFPNSCALFLTRTGIESIAITDINVIIIIGHCMSPRGMNPIFISKNDTAIHNNHDMIVIEIVLRKNDNLQILCSFLAEKYLSTASKDAVASIKEL